MLGSFLRFISSPAGIITLAGLITLCDIGLMRYFTRGQLEVRTNTAMRVLISIAILGSGLCVLLSSSYDDEAQKWASGSIGTIVGVWLPQGSNYLSVIST